MQTLKRKFKKIWQQWVPDSSTQALIAYNKAKYRPRANRRGRTDALVLVPLYSWKPSLFCISKLANELADYRQASIETFSFAEAADKPLEKVYASFGAELTLDYRYAKRFEDKAREVAERIFYSLTDKWSVWQIQVDNVILGDLIYNTYLRSLLKPTIDIHDKNLLGIIHKALMIYYAASEFFACKRITDVFVDHIIYLEPGILSRVAFSLNIPVYSVSHHPNLMLTRLDRQAPADRPIIWTLRPFYKYRQVYDTLPADVQQQGLERARKALEDRLSGKPDPTVHQYFSSYSPESDQRILKTTNTPKMLVLLHDFCDSVHRYRSMLFPDYYEWIHFLLEKAEQTNFEWYVKPHPHSKMFPQKNVANQAIVDELKEKFPRIHFLDSTVSNRQLIREGIQTMFTVHGTAGHEFPYMGVPVVNAGDNQHISFNFNVHPASIAEYEHCIATADRLILDPPDPEEVEAFFFMCHFYFFEKYSIDLQKIDLRYFGTPEFLARANQPEAYRDLILQDSDALDITFHRYMDAFLELDP